MSKPQTNSLQQNYVDDILASMESSTPEIRATLQKAIDFVIKIHGDKKRLSGEPYIVHSVETAKTLARLRMGPETVTAGVLHDSLGEEGGSEEEIRAIFGDTITDLIVNTLKLDRVKYHGDERYVESLRKLFLATAKDIRVLIIRLAHRLHNVQTLAAVPAEKREKIAEETIEIYAPIANRLGMRKLKTELEDAAFPFAHPAEYARTAELIRDHMVDAEHNARQFLATFESKLRDEKIAATISYRIKGTYSLFEKLEKYSWNFELMPDLLAFRAVVSSVEECYRVLGIVHGTWTPVPDRMRDYIATPKPNGYRSLHTIVQTSTGRKIEVQIRTKEMDDEAEYGIAAHLAYSETGKPQEGGQLGKKLQWIKQLLEWQKNSKNSAEFLEELKMDFFLDRVFAFTPHGDVIELPEGASPIDFAYAIHSDIGNHASAAVVNGKFVSLNTPLKNGDIVEIQTKKNSKPSHKWLEFAHTSEARKHIRMATELKK